MVSDRVPVIGWSVAISHSPSVALPRELLPPVSADATGGTISFERGEEAKASREWRVLDRLEKTALGKRGPDWVVTVRRREPAGCLLYGPYWQLPSGAYRLIFCCRSGKPRMMGNTGRNSSRSAS